MFLYYYDGINKNLAGFLFSMIELIFFFKFLVTKLKPKDGAIVSTR